MKKIIWQQKYYDILADLMEMFPDDFPATSSGTDDEEPLLPLTDEEREFLLDKLREAIKFIEAERFAAYILESFGG